MLGNPKTVKRNNWKCKGILIGPLKAPRFSRRPRYHHCIFDSPSRSHGRLRAQISRRGWQADAKQSMAWRTCRALRMSPHHRNVASGRQSANEIPSQALQFPFDVFESPIWLPIE
jgi:hypothetical protein